MPIDRGETLKAGGQGWAKGGHPPRKSNADRPRPEADGEPAAFNVTSIDIAPLPAVPGLPLNLTLSAETNTTLGGGAVMIQGKFPISPWAPPIPILFETYKLCELVAPGNATCAIAPGPFNGTGVSKPIKLTMPAGTYTVSMKVFAKDINGTSLPDTCVTFPLTMAPPPVPPVAQAESEARPSWATRLPARLRRGWAAGERAFDAAVAAIAPSD